MNAELHPFSFCHLDGKSKVPAAALLLLCFLMVACCMLLLSSWAATTAGLHGMSDAAVLIPAGSMSTDEPQFCNSPNREGFALGSRSTDRESKVESLTGAGRSHIKLDFIPVNERSNRSSRGFPCVTAPAGAYGIEGHGSPDSVFARTGEPMNAKELARWITHDSRYRPGMPVYLFCCETGKGGRPFAQKLADVLGTEVKAPTEKLWPLKTGLYIVARERTRKSLGMFDVGVQRADITQLGEMKTFRPSQENSTPTLAEGRIIPRDFASPELSSSSAAASPVRAQQTPKKPLLRASARTASLLAGIQGRADTTLYLNDRVTKSVPDTATPAEKK